MSVPVERWVAGGTRFLVVDAADHVPDRRAFAAAHCSSRRGGPTDGASPVESGDDGDGPTTVRGEADADGLCNDEDSGDPDGLDHPDAVLYLALDEAPTPPRVVTTLVGPDGRRPVTPAAARVAAAWTARRTGGEAAMVDTPRGTRRGAVADAPDGWAVTATDPRTGVDSRRPVRRTGAGTLAGVAPRPVE